tara:strand:- start:4969 stop:5196 length:228 start_codon:yes stop_codon:yes gene_type:complete
MIKLNITQKEWHLLVRSIRECVESIEDGYNHENYNDDGEYVEVSYSKEDQRDIGEFDKLQDKLNKAYRNDVLLKE